MGIVEQQIAGFDWFMFGDHLNRIDARCIETFRFLRFFQLTVAFREYPLQQNVSDFLKDCVDNSCKSSDVLVGSTFSLTFQMILGTRILRAS